MPIARAQTGTSQSPIWLGMLVLYLVWGSSFLVAVNAVMLKRLPLPVTPASPGSGPASAAAVDGTRAA